MDKMVDLQILVNLAMATGGRKHMRPVIEKELLHYDILFALDKAGLLDRLTFQGGTSLRLCHDAPRFSEDLDFVGGRSFATADLVEMKSCLENYIGKRYGLEVIIKEPEELAQEPEYREIKVDKWQISVITAPEQRHVPRQKVKIEVANIPSYSREPLPLQLNYDFLPDGYNDTFVLIETLDEIMADKIVSLVNCQSYIRYRDIWDLRWIKQHGARPRSELISAKKTDYNVVSFLEKAEDMIKNLPDIVHGRNFQEQMSRFLPLSVQKRTLRKEKFYPVLINEVSRILKAAQAIERRD